MQVFWLKAARPDLTFRHSPLILHTWPDLTSPHLGGPAMIGDNHLAGPRSQLVANTRTRHTAFSSLPLSRLLLCCTISIKVKKGILVFHHPANTTLVTSGVTQGLHAALSRTHGPALPPTTTMQYVRYHAFGRTQLSSSDLQHQLDTMQLDGRCPSELMAHMLALNDTCEFPLPQYLLRHRHLELMPPGIRLQLASLPEYLTLQEYTRQADQLYKVHEGTHSTGLFTPLGGGGLFIPDASVAYSANQCSAGGDGSTITGKWAELLERLDRLERLADQQDAAHRDARPAATTPDLAHSMLSPVGGLATTEAPFFSVDFFGMGHAIPEQEPAATPGIGTYNMCGLPDLSLAEPDEPSFYLEELFGVGHNTLQQDLPSPTQPMNHHAPAQANPPLPPHSPQPSPPPPLQPLPPLLQLPQPPLQSITPQQPPLPHSPQPLQPTPLHPAPSLPKQPTTPLALLTPPPTPPPPPLPPLPPPPLSLPYTPTPLPPSTPPTPPLPVPQSPPAALHDPVAATRVAPHGPVAAPRTVPHRPVAAPRTALHGPIAAPRAALLGPVAATRVASHGPVAAPRTVLHGPTAAPRAPCMARVAPHGPVAAPRTVLNGTIAAPRAPCMARVAPHGPVAAPRTVLHGPVNAPRATPHDPGPYFTVELPLRGLGLDPPPTPVQSRGRLPSGPGPPLAHEQCRERLPQGPGPPLTPQQFGGRLPPGPGPPLTPQHSIDGSLQAQGRPSHPSSPEDGSRPPAS